jgi:subtilisin-like proprotein convertase family protein
MRLHLQPQVSKPQRFSYTRHCTRHAILACSLALAALCPPQMARADVFNGTGGGLIPDNFPTGTTVSFNASGLVGQVQTVSVALDLTHTFAGDLSIQLLSPGGFAKLYVLNRAGRSNSSGAGYPGNLAGVYAFSDAATGNFWTTAAPIATSANIPTGSYRTSTGATTLQSSVGGCSSFLNLAFGGLPAARANGVWTLTVADLGFSDTGSINAANSSLTITMQAETPLFKSGFEDNEAPLAPAPINASATAGTCVPAVNSPSGSGLTDFVMVRGNAGAVDWSVKTNDGTAAGAVLPTITFGRDTDFFLMGDFDGDGASDFTVWQPGTPSKFRVRRSSRPNDAPLEIPFGTAGDVSDIIADYDGDHVTDFAVYRDGTPADTTAHFYIRYSSTGVVNDFAVTNSDGGVPAALRDYNGDGKADYLVQDNGGAGVGRFRIFSGANGTSLDGFNFALSSDFVIPGHVSGSALTDITISRNKINPATMVTEKMFQTRETGTGILGAETFVGVPGDFICQGDYDGDGITDYAIWRASTTAGQSKFVIRRSLAPATNLEVFHGASGDYPVNNWDVH